MNNNINSKVVNFKSSRVTLFLLILNKSKKPLTRTQIILKYNKLPFVERLESESTNSNGSYSLRKLDKIGLIESEKKKQRKTVGPSQVFYSITDEGREQAKMTLKIMSKLK